MKKSFSKKTKITILAVLFFLGLFLLFFAFDSTKSKNDVIHDFSSTINVLPDSSILVNEKINYDFEKGIRHGIYRDIPLLNSKKEPIEVKVISVTDELEKPYKFTTEISNGIIRIKIGDPDQMISGIKEYDINYQVKGAVTYYQDFDELYWNVTGNDWGVTIEKAKAKIILPNNVFPLQESCYWGKQGSPINCQISESGYFSSPSILNAGEGLTVAVGFSKDVVAVYQQKVESNFIKTVKVFWPVIIPITVFIFMFIRWFKKGRDSKGTGVIIPQYDVPDNLTPIEVGAIIRNKLQTEDISAEIIYLATKGYLKIKQIDCDKDNFLCLISENDYELTLLKEKGLLENNFDKKILTAIFGEKCRVGGIIKLSGLKKGFYKEIKNINNNVVKNLLEKGYFTNFPKQSSKGFALITIVFILGSFISLSFRRVENFVVLILSILLSMLVWFVFSPMMSAKSKKGTLTKEYLLGLKEYLQIAEKDRLNFHNAPDKKPEVFESLLPYAMVFGVEELWAKEFKDIYIDPPKWYIGSTSAFDAVSFSHDMSLFSSLTSSSISATPSGSGSSGGGFSGGGGGGGGGGSW